MTALHLLQIMRKDLYVIRKVFVNMILFAQNNTMFIDSIQIRMYIRVGMPQMVPITSIRREEYLCGTNGYLRSKRYFSSR